MLFELLSGEPPFWEGADRPPLEQQHGESLRHPGCLNPGADEVIGTLLQADENKRCCDLRALKNHDWLHEEEFDWRGLESGEAPLPATLSVRRVVF
mmetsp:Transcript_27406/g.66768  ORF Transcript_27406/g.66768 Transcript_27406/m.66768 type:complete len:96 (-) Transcript_27406:151-438(-)